MTMEYIGVCTAYGLTKDNTSKSSNTINASACLPNDKGVILNFPEQSCIKFYSRAQSHELDDKIAELSKQKRGL